MAGKYKVDKVFKDRPPQRRSSHKTEADAVLQARRMIKRDTAVVVAYNVSLDGILLHTIIRENKVVATTKED